MQYQYHDQHVGAQFVLTLKEAYFQRSSFQDKAKQHYFILWNRGADQSIDIDGMAIRFPSGTFFALNWSRSFQLKRSEDVAIWQFNKEFYCIIQHDEEVSCTGILLYSANETEPIVPDEKQQRLFGLLVEIFQDEFGTHDNIQGEMLRMLLKRLIIKLTRLVKNQTSIGNLGHTDLNTVRQFHMLVESHYKDKHQVQDYADLMHKSPKTLSNLFSKHSETGPLQVILDRLFLESKRLLIYTDMTSGEISQELGFAEPAHFSRFFKNVSGITASEFRKTKV